MPMTDRISVLPDSLISHIVSFLPMEQVVATSVLSKRWKPLWLTVPTLNFYDENYSENKDAYLNFFQLVYTVLLFQDGIHPIEKFKLMCMSELCHSSMVDSWLVAANQRKAKHLSLSLPTNISLPFSVFASATLVVLKLRGQFTVQKNYSSVSFPSLKVFHLRMICFEDAEHITEILSACPVLEVLVMKSLKFNKPLSGRLSKHLYFPKLVEADISEASLAFALRFFYNVKFLSANMIKKQDLSAHNFSNLTHMELHIYPNYQCDWVIEMLRYCPHLQSLVIDKSYAKCVEKWVQPQFVPECLISKLERFSVICYTGIECELQFSRFIMHNCRILRKVTICSGSFSNPQEKLQMIKDLSLYPRLSPMCQFHFE